MGYFLSVALIAIRVFADHEADQILQKKRLPLAIIFIYNCKQDILITIDFWQNYQEKNVSLSRDEGETFSHNNFHPQPQARCIG